VGADDVVGFFVVGIFVGLSVCLNEGLGVDFSPFMNKRYQIEDFFKNK